MVTLTVVPAVSVAESVAVHFFIFPGDGTDTIQKHLRCPAAQHIWTQSSAFVSMTASEASYGVSNIHLNQQESIFLTFFRSYSLGSWDRGSPISTFWFVCLPALSSLLAGFCPQPVVSCSCFSRDVCGIRRTFLEVASKKGRADNKNSPRLVLG